MTDGIELAQALNIARVTMRTFGLAPEEAVAQLPGIVPQELHAEVLEQLERELAHERTLRIQDLRMLEDKTRRHRPWLHEVDRREWYYWPALRLLLLNRPHWVERGIDQLDNATDRILSALESPEEETFDVRGLVVGYVQSGKTANYTALAAKAADTGYRVVIVFTGIHDSLRLQTQRRLDAELAGEGPGAVPRPPDDKLWYKVTQATMGGDFDPGTNSPDVVVGSSQPSLFVVKKHVRILARLIDWFSRLPEDARARLPVLIIDDEADQASVNTRGNRPAFDLNPDGEIEEPDALVDESPPSTTNERIRRLIGLFSRTAYVAYTATPFANVLIDHEAQDRLAGPDLYPKDFIVALPPPVDGYYGAESLFGRFDDHEARELDVIRRVPDEDAALLVPRTRAEADGFEPLIPESLERAVEDFILAGAARMDRVGEQEPATMLIHTDYRRALHQRLYDRIVEHMTHLRNEWRYSRDEAIEARLRTRWENNFRRVTRAIDVMLDKPFEEITPHINTFLEYPVEVLQINSSSDDVLDYDRDPSQKCIVVGGNRLSRGLTLDCLLVSYYVRRARNYDTLMQMGRWFGYRQGYVDLTRIYLTEDLEGWFRALVGVELELRDDIIRYERDDLTPLDFSVKIRVHPGMMVTNRAKMRSAQRLDASPSFEGKIEQTITFPFHDTAWLGENIRATKELLSSLGPPSRTNTQRPAATAVWDAVSWESVCGFLNDYRTDPDATRVDADMLASFVRQQAENHAELVEWVVGVMGQRREVQPFGSIDLGISGDVSVNMIERTRMRNLTNSLKAIISTSDQALGLSEEERRRAEEEFGGGSSSLRQVRDPRQGLLLIYPISKYSGWDIAAGDGLQRTSRLPPERAPIYERDPDAGEDVIGIALAFPKDLHVPPPQSYVTGTVGAGEP